MPFYKRQTFSLLEFPPLPREHPDYILSLVYDAHRKAYASINSRYRALQHLYFSLEPETRRNLNKYRLCAFILAAVLDDDQTDTHTTEVRENWFAELLHAGDLMHVCEWRAKYGMMEGMEESLQMAGEALRVAEENIRRLEVVAEVMRDDDEVEKQWKSFGDRSHKVEERRRRLRWMFDAWDHVYELLYEGVGLQLAVNTAVELMHL